MISYTQQDIERLRDLGRKVREIAELPIQKERIQLWTNVNDLHMTKPVLYHRDTPGPVLNFENELTTQIEDPWLRGIEYNLLLRLYNWKHMPLDYVVEDSVKCECAIKDSGWGELMIYDSDLSKDRQGQTTVHFPQLIKDMDDVERQCEDTSRDMECYTDSQGNKYDFAFGMNHAGVIRDARVEKYAVPVMTGPDNKGNL